MMLLLLLLLLPRLLIPQRLGLLNRHLGEDTSGPAISIHHRLLDQDVATKARHQHRPHQIIDSTEGEDAQRHHTVQVVRQAVVDTLSSTGGHVGCHHQVHVGQAEEDGDGKSCPNTGGPVGEVLLLGQVDVDETAGHEDVDDGQRVRDEVHEEVVGIAGRRGQHDDHGDDPVLEEASGGRVERPVAGPDLRQRENSFATEGLDDCYVLLASLDISHW